LNALLHAGLWGAVLAGLIAGSWLGAIVGFIAAHLLLSRHIADLRTEKEFYRGRALAGRAIPRSHSETSAENQAQDSELIHL